MKTRIFITAATLWMLTASSLFAQATGITGKFYIWPNWTHSKTGGASTVNETFTKIINDTVTFGTNDNQMNALCVYSGSLTNNETFEMSLLTATNSFGDAVAFDRVNFLCFKSTGGSVKWAESGMSFSSVVLGSDEDEVNIKDGGVALFYAPDSTGYSVGAYSIIKIKNTTAIPDGLYRAGNLAIDDGIATAFQTTNESWYSISDAFYTDAATSNIVFSSNDTVNIAASAANLFGIWQVQVDAAGAITTRAPSTNQVYTSSALALAALPAVDAANVSLGYVIVSCPTSTAWVANSSNLTGLATFTDAAASAEPSVAYKLYIGGTKIQ